MERIERVELLSPPTGICALPPAGICIPGGARAALTEMRALEPRWIACGVYRGKMY